MLDLRLPLLMRHSVNAGQNYIKLGPAELNWLPNSNLYYPAQVTCVVWESARGLRTCNYMILYMYYMICKCSVAACLTSTLYERIAGPVSMQGNLTGVGPWCLHVYMYHYAVGI